MKFRIKDKHFRDFIGAASAQSPDVPAPHKLEGELRHQRRKHKPRGQNL